MAMKASLLMVAIGLFCVTSEAKQRKASIFMPSGIGLMWSQKEADFEAMKKAQGEDVDIIMVGLPTEFWSSEVANEINLGTNVYDGFIVMAPWVGDYLVKNGIEDLSDYVKYSPTLNWGDVFPFVREVISAFDRKVYLVPVDLDAHLVLYREDVREMLGVAKPDTWPKFIELIKQAHGKDLNGDGTPDYGCCVPTVANEFGTWNFLTIVTSMMQSKGSKQGAFFDKKSMRSFFDTEAFKEAARVYSECLRYGPAPYDEELEAAHGPFQAWNGSWGSFWYKQPREGSKPADPGNNYLDTQVPSLVQGRCAATFDWTASGTAQFPQGWFGTGQVVNKLRTTLVGYSKVLDQDTREFRTCDAELCPYAELIDGELINKASYIAGGGMGGAINSKASQDAKDLVFEFMTYMSINSKEFVVAQGGWIQPYRDSQLDRKFWTESSGLDEPSIENYLNAMADSINSPNAVLDIRVPGFNDFYGSLDARRVTFLQSLDFTDDASIEAAIDVFSKGVTEDWNRITDEQGVDQQRRFYRVSLGDYSYSDEEAKRCQPGTHWDASQFACRDCMPGYMSAVNGMTACDLCLPGTVAEQPGLSACSNCPMGNFTAASGSSACEGCPPGRIAAETGLAECTSCRVGRFVGGLGNTACLDCAANAVKNPGAWTTIERTETDSGGFEWLRFSGASDASACACQADFYKKDGHCETCPEGMACSIGSDDANFATASSSDGPGGNKSAPYPVVLPRHWSAKSAPTSVFVCKTDLNCPGGAPESCGERLEDRACARCEEDYRFDGEACTPCTSVETSRVLFPVLPIILGPVVIAGIYKFFGDTIDKWGSWQNTCTCLGFIVLNHYQILDLVRGSDVVLPEMLKDLFEGWSFTNDFASLLKTECAGIRDFQSSFIVKTLSPLFILAIVLFTKVVSIALSKVTKMEWMNMESNRLFNAFGSIMFTFFSAISGLSLLLFKCTENPNGKTTLTADLSVICTDDQWSGMVVAAVAAVLVYCVGFGSVFAKVIFEAPRGKNFDSPAYQMRWKFLFIKFRPTVWWWALLFLAKNFLVNLGFALFTYGVGQIFWSMSVTIVYTILAVAFMPYRARIANMLELAASLSIVYVTALVLWFTERDEEYDDQVALTAGIISFMPLVLGLVTIAKLALYGLTKPNDEKNMIAGQYDKFVASLKQYMVLCEEKPALAKTFYETVGEWDRWHMMNAAEVISFELLGKGLMPSSVRLVDWTSSRTKMMKEIEGSTSKAEAGATEAVV